MKPQELPWMKLNPAEVLTNERFLVLGMSARGLLYTLQLFCWKNGSIPADMDTLARLVGCDDPNGLRTDYERIAGAFQPDSEDPERRICPDVEALRSEAKDSITKRTEAALKANKARWNKENNKPSKRTPNGLRTDPIKKKSTEEDKEVQSTAAAPPLPARDEVLIKAKAEVVNLWNKVALKEGYAVCRKLTGKVDAALGARLKEKGWFEAFRQVLTLMPQDPFYAKGSKDYPNFRGNMEHITRPGKVEEIVSKMEAVLRTKPKPKGLQLESEEDIQEAIRFNQESVARGQRRHADRKAQGAVQ